MMAEMRIDDFLGELSSSAAVPGGGGASALVGALGMALGSMVGNLTTGKKKYAEYQEEIEQAIVTSTKITKELAEFMDKDAEAFEPLSKAYGLPKNTPKEIEKRNEIMEKALLEASLAPLHLMEKIMEAMKVLERLSVIGSQLAISDVGVGISLCDAALNGASFNVYINTNLMKNREVAQDLNQQADDLIKEGKEISEKTLSTVMGKIRS